MPHTQARRRLVFGSLTFFLAHLPKASALPVFDRMPTRPPKSAQNRNILIFHPSVRTSANKSVNLRRAVTGFPPATMSAPETIPINSDMITSFVINARVIVKTGGTSPQIPKFSITSPFYKSFETLNKKKK